MPLDMHETALFARAVGCFKDRRYNPAEQICQQILAKNKKAVEVLELLGEILMQWQKHREAISPLERAVDLQPKAARPKVMLARAALVLGQYAKARTQLERALRIEPGNLYAMTLLADVFQRSGEPSKARQILEPVVNAGTEDSIAAGVWAALELEDGRAQQAADIIDKHVQRGPVHFNLLFTLGKAYEKCGNIDKAFEAYTMANTALPNSFNLDGFIAHIETVLEVFSAEGMAKLPRANQQSQMPLFVTGRPRSGTTLVEKILNAHPAVYGAGELTLLRDLATKLPLDIDSTQLFPKCLQDASVADMDRVSRQYLDAIRDMGRGAKRVVDKGMGLHVYMGLVSLLLPKARVIWVRRNPIDNCFACFTENLVHNHTYAQDLRYLGITHWFYEKAMRHWQTVLDLPIMEIQYEDLVDNQEQWSRNIIEFCGLDWSDECLRFYENKKFSARSSAQPTLSNAQVRKPIYKTSVGRAERFNRHLQPLLDALAEGEAMVKGTIAIPRSTGPHPNTPELASAGE